MRENEDERNFRDVMAKVQDRGRIVRVFELQSYNYVHFRIREN